MSNPVNTVDLSQSLTAFLQTHADLLQQKVDKPGGAVTAVATIKFTGANWGNFFDDYILSYMNSNARLVKVTGNTTDDTPNVVIGNAIDEVPDGSQVLIDTKIWGRKGPNDFVYAQYISRVERNGGTLQGPQTNAVYTDLSPTLKYSFNGTLAVAGNPDHFVNGNAVEIRVAGEDATNISWEAQTSVVIAHG
jgi:hypothetical protein